MAVICLSCSDSEEGFIGEWEGVIEIVGSTGKPVESKISCTIKSISDLNRSVKLSLIGKNYEFEATEDMDLLLFKNIPLGEESEIMTYISGQAELVNDTLLHFEHEIYTLKNGALTNSEDFEYDLVRK